MAQLQKLVRLMDELDDALVSCMRCGMCQSVCPVFAHSGKEAMVARGKIALLEQLSSEMIKDPKGVKEKLDTCLLCGACQAACPSGVQSLDIFLKARAILTGYIGLSPAKKIIFRGMLQNPKLMNAVVDLGSKFQGLFTKQANEIIGSSCSRFFGDVIDDRHIVPLAKKPFHKIAPSVHTRPEKGMPKVAFFPGCAVDKMFPTVGEASLKVLAHHGVGVFMPESQSCCGIPALSSGDRETFDKLVMDNIELFTTEGYDYFLTPCATCTATIKEIWPSMADKYPADVREKIKKLAEKAMDINAFVVNVLGVSAPAEAPTTAEAVTFHDSCHMKKSLKVSAEPRALIGASGKYKVVEMNEADVCCGCGGSFTLMHYDLSKKIGGQKRDNVVATQAGTVSTGCPACMMQLTDMLSQNGDKVRVRHSIEMYAESL